MDILIQIYRVVWLWFFAIKRLMLSIKLYSYQFFMSTILYILYKYCRIRMNDCWLTNWYIQTYIFYPSLCVCILLSICIGAVILFSVCCQSYLKEITRKSKLTTIIDEVAKHIAMKLWRIRKGQYCKCIV